MTAHFARFVYCLGVMYMVLVLLGIGAWAFRQVFA